uniref:Putative gag protein n=1 Tax=Zea mays TaxID=4577 RepID=Q7XBD0_MAIZE|nr:putative gag protein [Zea mays]
MTKETQQEARSQKRKATIPTPQEEELDQEIRDLEAIHQQVQRKREKMLRLADLQKRINKATEKMCHLTQNDQDRRPQHRELRQESPFNDDEWYGDFHQGNFAFDNASPLAAELQATLWPPSYKAPQLPMYDGHSDPKQFLMRFLRLRAQAPTVPNEIVIEAMIKGLRPEPTAQYFASKALQTLEKLLQKMDEYIRADNDFRQRREEAYRYSKLARGFGWRFHPMHVSQQLEGHHHAQQQRDFQEESKARTVNGIVPESKHIY